MRTTTQARRRIREWALKRGERSRIARQGDVHVYGRMPNSIVTGWWLAGPVGDVLRRIEQAAAANASSAAWAEGESV